MMYLVSKVGIKSVCDQIAKAGFHVVILDVYGDEKTCRLGGFSNPEAQKWHQFPMLMSAKNWTGV